jgi:hypothetical protein
MRKDTYLKMQNYHQPYLSASSNQDKNEDLVHRFNNLLLYLCRQSLFTMDPMFADKFFFYLNFASTLNENNKISLFMTY